MVISVSVSTGLPATAGSASNLARRRLEHVEVDVRRRPEAAALDQDRLLAQHLARLQHLAVGAEHRHAAEPELHQLERHQPVVDAAELDAVELDHVDLDAAGGQPVEQALDELVRLVVLEERAVQQVHADDAERLLLQRASASSIRTCMTIWLGSSCGWDWNFTPIQPWHSLPPL